MRNLIVLFVAGLSVLAVSCKKESGDNGGGGSTVGAKLIFKFKFDSTQARLNNVGQPSTIAAGNAAQSPVFNKMSAHYLELAPTATTPLGNGTVIYKAAETTTGGAKAIDFEKASDFAEGEAFFYIPLKTVPPGEYEWLRLSLAYQNFDVKYYIDTTINSIQIKQEFLGTLAGFIGFNTYIKTFKIKTSEISLNANRAQGYWGFETTVNVGANYTYVTDGQAPAGATTVPNPLFATSPIPAGSCVVTGAFSNVANNKLKITGQETSDIVVEVSLSTNKSFEWKDLVVDGKWSPSKGETVVDMGIRGMIPKVL